MKCEVYQELISADVDGMLSLHEEAILRQHLQECESCRNTYEALVEITKACNQLDEEPLPEDFHQNLMTRIQKLKSTQDLFNMKDTKDIENKKCILLKKVPNQWKWHYGLIASLMIVGVFLSQLERLAQYKNESTVERPISTLQNLPKGRMADDVREDTPIPIDLEEPMLENVIIPDEVGAQGQLFVTEIEVFKTRLEAFLIKNTVEYERIEGGYRITSDVNRKILLNWLEEQCDQIGWRSDKVNVMQCVPLDLMIYES